jgi:serine/threonine protein kinase
VIVGIIVVIIVVAIIAFVFRWKFGKKNCKCLKLSGKNVSEDDNDINGYVSKQTEHQKNLKMENRINSKEDIKRQAFLLSYDTKREISRSLFTVTEVIGCGNFGNVSKGELDGLYGPNSKTTVAVKSMNGPNDGAELTDFLQEIKIMSYIKPHLNLVNMIGSCSSYIQSERELWLIIEFCPHGDLKSYLFKNKIKVLTGNEKDALNDRCLVYWLYEISKGMAYLSENKIMHGDLAARNVLLDDNLMPFGHPVAKIADFGLSKRFYDKLKYEKESRVHVPWKWMALEYLTCEYFTLTSDVWSLGVVLWEIFSLGRVPYGQQSYHDVLKSLESGDYLECPDDINIVSSWSPKTMYDDLSKICFVKEPDKRGTFKDVVSVIEQELSDAETLQYRELNETYQNERCRNYIKIGQNT